jgi:hypothetical protein
VARWAVSFGVGFGNTRGGSHEQHGNNVMSREVQLHRCPGLSVDAV